MILPEKCFAPFRTMPWPRIAVSVAGLSMIEVAFSLSVET
jgi:hypothetical protein